MRKIIILIILIMSVFNVQVMGEYSEQDYNAEIKKQFESYDFSEFNLAAEKSGTGLNPQKIAEDTATGKLEINLSIIIDFVVDKLFSEVLLQSDLMKTIFGLCVLCGVLKLLSSSFSQGTASLAYYICFISAITAITVSFATAGKIVIDTSKDLDNIIKASIPLLCGGVITSGGAGGAAVMLPVSVMVTEMSIKLTEIFFIPMINICGGIGIVNYFSEKPLLTKLTDFLSQVTGWALKGFAIISLGILGLYRIGNATSSQTAMKVLKAGAGAVPVVGDILSGSVQTVAVFGTLIKNGIGVAAAVVIIVCSFVPFMKILAMVVACKITAAITQPMGERGISECIDTAGNIISMMLGVIIMMIVIFISTVLIFISLNGG